MPLNLTQRKALREALSKHIDLLFTDLAAEQYLPQVIEDIALSRPEVIAHLKQHRHLIQDLVKVNNLEASVRKDLKTLLEKLDSEKPIIPQSLLYRHPNYNPMNIVEMKQFGDRLIAKQVKEQFCVPLIALRELYLEMTPLSQGNSQYRIGGVPLELDKLGDIPSSGEISAEVLEYITLRVKLKAEYEQGGKRCEEEIIAKINCLNDCQEVIQKGGGGSDETADRGSSSIKTETEGAKKNQTCDDGVSSIDPHCTEINVIQDANGDTQCYLGLKCQFGPENSNMTKAISWYTKAAEQGHLLALQILRYYHQEGLEVEKSERMAGEFMHKFNECLKKHKCAIEQNEYYENDLSFKLLEQLAKTQQNQLLQFLMALCFHYGLGVTKCMKTAVEWYQLSAEQGNAFAQNNLGNCYHNGEGVEQSYEEAVKWYRLAAEKGNAIAQNRLANCYYLGKGVERKYEEAVKWYRLSADQGNAVAQNNLGDCYYHGKGVERNDEEAVKWFRLADERGNADAQYSLGICYYYGKGVEQSYEEAVKWYRLAADQGKVIAQNRLANCYYNGEGVEQSYEEAVKWYRLSAEKGSAMAQDKLGDCYYYGEGVEKNYEKAMKWYRSATDMGHSAARYKLGTCQRMINKQMKTRTQKREEENSSDEEDNDRNRKKPRL